MKKYALIIVAVFISTTVYAADAPGWFQQWKKPAQQTDSKKEVVPAPIKASAAPVVVVPVAPMAAVVPAERSAPAPQGPQKKLDKKEILTRINEILTGRPNLVSTIPGLEAKQEGKVTVYTYNGKKLEDLDDETIFRINGAINQQISLENLQKLDRQERQLRNLRQIDQLNKTQRMLKQQRDLSRPTASKTYTPPKIPRTQRY